MSARVVHARPAAAGAAGDVLYPLSHFRREGGRPVPACLALPPPEVPEPFRTLLVHGGDMTSRLEAYHGGGVALEVLREEHAGGDLYRREVVLRVEGTPVEYGAIEIELGAVAPALRAAILDGGTPLGGLLHRYGVPYESRPRAFFRLGADDEMEGIFELPGTPGYHGRANELRVAGGRTLARIVEVLHPVSAPCGHPESVRTRTIST